MLFRSLLAVIGEEQRENMINMARERIRDDVRFHGTHASFLLDVGRTAAAAEYVMAHAGELDGNLYNSLLPLADEMAKAGQPLAASLLYRALLLSILERGYTKAYPHGIRYLKKLEKLAAAITDWQGVSGHAAFLEILHRDHGRKTSFWSKCGA